MPTYDYACSGCGHRFEKFQSMTAKVLRKCPECGERTLERLIGAGAGILFKGGGFYETDYRTADYKKAAESDSKPAKPAKKPKTPKEKGAGQRTKPSSGD